MSAQTKEQTAAIRETRWQLQAALDLSHAMGFSDEDYGSLSGAKDAALLQAAAYLISQNYQRLITDQNSPGK